MNTTGINGSVLAQGRAIILLFILVAGCLHAAEPVYTGRLTNTAAGGYDVVSYFQSEFPVKGKKKFSIEYKGADWRFASAMSLAAFNLHYSRGDHEF